MASSAMVAGFEDPSNGEWRNTEAGDRAPTAEQLESSPSIVVRATDSDGERHYFTTSYLSADLPLDDVVDRFSAQYGVEFV